MKNLISYDQFYRITKGKILQRGINKAKSLLKGTVYYTRDSKFDNLNMKETVKYYMIDIDNSELSKKMGREHSIYFLSTHG